MKASLLLAFAITLNSPEAVSSFRLKYKSHAAEVVQHEAAELTRGNYCCCKQAKCEEGAVADDDETDAVYSPNENLCCKFKGWTCTNWFQMSAYKLPMEDKYCQKGASWEDLDQHFSPPELHDPEKPINVTDLAPGSPGHTVHSYCDFSKHAHKGDEEGGAEGGEETHHQRNEIIKSLIHELSKNSIDTMAKEIFSIYICMRWAPSPEFVDVASMEIKTGQLPNTSTPLELYRSFRFMPLKCTKNVNVYGRDTGFNQTHFEQFEAEMTALSKWYDHEKDGALAKRLQKITYAMKHDVNFNLEAEAKVFNITGVGKAANLCVNSTAPILVNTFDANAEQLLGDCGAVKWWYRKLQDWHRAMPFESFMSPDEHAASQAAPESGEQVLVCFGKRVASQLHRREMGTHLLTDQSAVGCHGFWDLPTAAKMLDRVIALWRPPTCQLAAMELDMKIKIMELMASMNSNLFDALPAMLVEEMGGADWDGKQLEASSGLGILRGVWNSIVSSFSNLKGSYTRLGQLLGNTVVKWVVCPLKPITNATRLEMLDASLGTEDDLARYYAEIAYSEWTGKENLLPGQECTIPTDKEGGLYGLSRTKHCSLGEMRENMPEPYNNEDFVCPTRPLLPAKQQLDIFKEKRDWCLMYMHTEQMKKENWFYRGRTPQLKQYNMTTNIPTVEYQSMKVLSTKSRPDTDFGIWRDFVTVGRGCTEEEAAKTPRWCQAPEVKNQPSTVTDLLSGGVELVGGAIGGALDPDKISNNAFQERLGQWFYTKVKGAEMWFKGSGSEFVGKAAGRYSKLYQRSFSEVEANELLHSTSFQKELANTGADSKNYQKYDRFAVVSPCTNFDPDREFDLKYRWAENALQLARKANQNFAGALSKKGFTVELRGAGVLSMRNEQNAWMTYSTHLRAAGIDDSMPMWVETGNPFLNELSGALNTRSDSGVKATDLLGFEALFTCGTRQDMHDLALKSSDVTSSDAHLKQDFVSCVKQGKERNVELWKSNPTQSFLKDEVVVRVVLSELAACQHEVDTSGMQFSNETQNAVFKNFDSVSGCRPIDKNALPEDLRSAQTGGNYRGMLLGKGLPSDTLVEIIVDPADIIDELGL